MKKLKLKALELSATEILTREQLKNVMGAGSGQPGECRNNYVCTTFYGPCYICIGPYGTCYRDPNCMYV